MNSDCDASNWPRAYDPAKPMPAKAKERLRSLARLTIFDHRELSEGLTEALDALDAAEARAAQGDADTELAQQARCAQCGRPAAFGVDPNWLPARCREHALAAHEVTRDGLAIEAAEAALSKMVPTIDELQQIAASAALNCPSQSHMDQERAGIQAVAEALGVKVVRHA